jgi:hypothetical protein
VKLVFIIIFLSFLSGCSSEHNIDTNNIGEITILIEQKRLVFKSGSTVNLKVKEWISRNRGGWESYYATPAIGKYVIKGEAFTMYIQSEFAILNYEHSSGKYVQISKPVTAQEFDFIVQ